VFNRNDETGAKIGALQSAIFNSADFSSIAADTKGVIQIFNVGAERMLGFTARRGDEQDHAGRHFRSAEADRAR
jgi:sensor histidine kinase regulating citrate/malate metabolism